MRGNAGRQQPPPPPVERQCLSFMAHAATVLGGFFYLPTRLHRSCCVALSLRRDELYLSPSFPPQVCIKSAGIFLFYKPICFSCSHCFVRGFFFFLSGDPTRPRSLSPHTKLLHSLGFGILFRGLGGAWRRVVLESNLFWGRGSDWSRAARIRAPFRSCVHRVGVEIIIMTLRLAWQL
jgi:hypothetical protein